MKKKLILIFILFFNAPLFAQNSSMDLARYEMYYWKLRGALTGDENNRDVYNGFMQVGAGKGKSLPAAIRFPTYGREYWRFNYVTFPTQIAECYHQQLNGVRTGNQSNPSLLPDPRDGNELKGINYWGDNPIITLGQYIGVLALEWNLLHREGGNTQRTLEELYYALEAVDRLDLEAEPSLYNLPPDKNGFMIRGDVPKDFELSDDGENIDMVLAHTACRDGNNPHIENHPCEVQNMLMNPLITIPEWRYREAMSQDEVIGLLFGFAIAEKMFYGNTSSITFNGVNLFHKMQAISDRVIKYVRRGGYGFWVLNDPKYDYPVCRGPWGIFFSYPMAKIGKYISGNVLQNWHSSNTGLAIWLAMKQFLALNNQNGTIIVSLPSPLANALNLYPNSQLFWKNDYGSFYRFSMLLKVSTAGKAGSMPANFDFKGKYFNYNVSSTFQKNLYDLAGSIFYDYKPVQSHAYWESLFNQMNCGCNCVQTINPNGFGKCDYYFNNANPPQGGHQSFNWNLEDRWASSYMPTDNPLHAEFNGLDYMMTYLMYKYKFLNSGFNDSRIRRYINNSVVPWSFTPVPQQASYTFGTGANPIYTKAVHAIEATNTLINQGGYNHYRAGSDIKLKLGFIAKPGSVFTAKIEDYDCTPIYTNSGSLSSISYKTEDSSGNLYIDINDTAYATITEDSTNFEPEPTYDTTIIKYVTSGDTTWISFNPDYTFDEEGNPVYAPQGSYKTTLQPLVSKSISLYPNPTNTHLFIEFTLFTESEVKIWITDALGRKLPNLITPETYTLKAGNQKHTINTSDLPPGVYYCNIVINDHKECKRFTVIK